MNRLLQCATRILIKMCLASFLLLSNLSNTQAQISGTKTIGPTGTYASLTAAFTAASASGINGALLLELQSTYLSTSETFPISIANISGVSSNNTITIRPQTGATGLSISSSNGTATFDINGARYIIIDGRPGGIGSTIAVPNTTLLSIINTSASGVAVSIKNDASYNTVKYCDLQGANQTTGQVPGSSAGVVFIGPTTGSTGNDYNTIDNCNIHSNSNTNVCTMGVYSYGPTGATTISGAFNENNTISNCNIYDMYGGANLTTAGIECEKGTSDWVITGNSIFQTVSRTPTLTAAIANRGIYIATTNTTGVGNGFTITGNFIGGSAPRCGGSSYTFNPSGAFNALFDGITLTVAGGLTSNVKSNTITNLNLSQGASTSDLFHGIWCQNVGNVNVGGPLPTDGNLVGSTTTTGAITLNSAGAGLTHNPIYVISGPSTSSTNILFQNNAVGGINLTGAGNGFSGIFCNATGPTVVIDNNLVGSTTVNNSINASDPTGTYVLFVNGIRSPSGSAILTITNNTIANLNNNNTSTTGSSGITNTSISQTGGIVITGAGTATQTVLAITGNKVKNLSCAAYQTGNYVNTVMVGIGTVASGGNPTIISNNLVDSMVNTSAQFGTSGQNILMTGIFYYGTTSNVVISRNFIHSFDISANNPGCTFRGIEVIGGPAIVSNNMIRLGYKPDGSDLTNPILIYALLTEGSQAHTLYHNSVYVGGAGVTGTDPTYTYWRYNVATDDIRNNIFVNTRANATGGSGKHYTLFLTATTSLTLNNNIYYGVGTGNVFATNNNGSSDVSAYTSNWVSGDANSFAVDPGFVNQTGNAKLVNLHLLAPGYKGVSITTTGITDDYDGDKRSSLPEIGADEFPYDLGVSAIDSPTTSSFCGQSKPIYVHIKNYGLLPINAATINISVNGLYVSSYNWVGNLASGVTSPAININSYNFIGGNYKLAVSTALPSGITDNNTNNDSSSVSFSVTPTAVPSITITTPYTAVCLNSPVTFKATYANGGTSPVFQWKKNNVNVGTNDTIYTLSNLANGDTVLCTLTSNAPCANPNPAVSSQIKMIVGATLPPSVTVSTNDTNICAGGFSNFKATGTNGGTAPHYQWKKNGINVGIDSVGFKLTGSSNKDSVTCIMTSNLSCASKSADTAKYITITVNPLLTPTITIAATSTSFCNGVMDTFTSVITNGGTNPVYQWRLSTGQVIGGNVDKFVTATLKDKDSVYATVTSNAACLAQSFGTSAKIGVTVIANVTVSNTISATKNNICTGESVDFKATYSNGGNAPVKKWYKNTSLLSGSADSITVNNFSNLDSVYFVLTSNAPCVTPTATVTSNKQVMNVNNYVTPSVTVSTPSTSICSGTALRFSAKPINGGSTPHYDWKKNGLTVGTDDTVYTSSTINNADSIFVILKGSALCQTKTADTSAKVIITVTPSVTPTISVTTNSTTICQNANTLFSTSITNGGSNPHYQWKKNGIVVGSDSNAFQTSTLNTKDTVYVYLTSNATCASSNTVGSNKLIFQTIAITPTSVVIAESENNICAGKSVTFFATPTNGGLTPHYQWLKNGNSIGTDVSQYTTDSLSNNDSISVLMTSSISCALPTLAPSNKIKMSVLTKEIPEVTAIANPSTACNGTVVTFTATDSLPLSAKVHRWFKNGVIVGSDSTKYTVAVSLGDKIKCVLYANATCVSKASDTSVVNLTINPVPAKPTVTRTYDTLRASTASSYQWYLNNVVISTATNQQYIALENGSYKVTVSSLGCSNTSDTIPYYTLAVNTYSNSGNILSLYPNPTQDEVFVDAKYLSDAETIIVIFDMTGKEISRSVKGKLTSLSREPLHMNELSDGVYLVYVKHGDEVQFTKVVKGKN